MSKQTIKQAEIQSAKNRLKGFIKPAKQVNHHDPERMRRVREGREHEPRLTSWEELGRRWRVM